MNVLFICNQNQNRSRAAEELFQYEFSTRSAGLFNDNPLTEEQLAWADTVVVMEDHQRSEIAKRFPRAYLQKRIISLDIPDVYARDNIELKEQLRARIKELF
jgi:predicted protein tyrosine phosphatase